MHANAATRNRPDVRRMLQSARIIHPFPLALNVGATAALAPSIGQIMMRLTGVQGAIKQMADQRAAKR